MSSLVRTLVGSLMLLATSLSVQAGETVKKKKVKAAPAAASSAIAKTPAVEPFNPFMIRLRAIAIGQSVCGRRTGCRCVLACQQFLCAGSGCQLFLHAQSRG